MNYLAHLYLAEDNPESLLGNLMGDFVKGTVPDFYSERIARGIKLHRKVDSYTDSHNIFKRSKRLMSPLYRRYSGILIDVFYDHFLAKNWSNYSSISLQDFTNKVYKALQDYYDILPESLRRVIPNLIRENWLMSYTEIEGISFTLKRISTRIKRENCLGDAADQLTTHYELLASDFRLFFPELIDYSRQ